MRKYCDSLPKGQQSCILAWDKGEERTVHSPEPTMHTTANHALIKGTNIQYFLSEFTVAFTLQEYSATLDAQVKRGRIYFLWPEVWFQTSSTSEFSRGSQPAHSQLFTNKIIQWQYQTGACPWKPDSYRLLCAWHWIFYPFILCTCICLQRNG